MSDGPQNPDASNNAEKSSPSGYATEEKKKNTKGTKAPAGFLAVLSPSGQTWADVVKDEAPTKDANGYLSGPWGSCLASATRYEAENRSWGRDPVYKKCGGPCGLVIDHLMKRGHGRFEKAADKLERATAKAIKAYRSGTLKLDDKSPEVWQTAFGTTSAAADSDGEHTPSESDSDSSGSSKGSSKGKGKGKDKGKGKGEGKDGGSGSECDSENEEDLLAMQGLSWPLPWQCCMNDEVANAASIMQPEFVEFLPADTTFGKPKKVSDGWHEGYLLKFTPTLIEGESCKAILRIWRSQLSYWRLEVPTGAAVELRAMELSKEAGVITADCPAVIGRGGKCQQLTGVCARAPHGEPCDWAMFKFVEHARSRKKIMGGLKQKEISEDDFVLQTMARLHSLDLTTRDTAPLARFDSWQAHVAYLKGLAAETENAEAMQAVDTVGALLESCSPPELPPAVCHLDWHLGNVLLDEAGELKAVIDWEFAGVGDPRLDLARLCTRQCFSHGSSDGGREERSSAQDSEEAQALWRKYAAVRFGPDSSDERLGPMEPWLALESLRVFILCATLCSRVARWQKLPEDQRGDGPPNVPRCDLCEWIEDMESSKDMLRELKLMPPRSSTTGDDNKGDNSS